MSRSLLTLPPVAILIAQYEIDSITATERLLQTDLSGNWWPIANMVPDKVSQLFCVRFRRPSPIETFQERRSRRSLRNHWLVTILEYKLGRLGHRPLGVSYSLPPG